MDAIGAGNDEHARETRDWIASFEAVLALEGAERAAELLRQLESHAQDRGLPHLQPPVSSLQPLNTPYVNTIPVAEQASLPGNHALEHRIKNVIRWNAMAMVVRANREEHGIGGHISSYASAATLYEIGFNHFFRGKESTCGGDQVFFQGHASPGIYARAFLEGRLTKDQLGNFRRELRAGGGLSSYPHPWLMPAFWEFPTVSMGLGPIMAIYQARFNRYLEDRGLKPESDGKVWAFLGDGETDEPESLGALTLAARERLDNLIFVVNCNLQRLDGPVRGNGKIIQELEAAFRGAGWNVIKVIWSSDWDALFARDTEGRLRKRLEETVDGQFQKYSVSSGAYIREHFFGADPKLLELVADFSDEQLRRLNRGGHDPSKVYAAYRVAVEHRGSPTVILAHTIKGYGLGEAGEGRNITHQQKKMNEDELRDFRARFDIPVPDEAIAFAPFFKPPEDSPEIQYPRERRAALGGCVPCRRRTSEPVVAPDDAFFEEFFTGTNGRAVSTTMAYVRMLAKLLHHPELGKLVVPIVPDEARTFGMEALFRQVGIYAHGGQHYDPVDADNLLYYREARDGQIIEEGITEAGSMSSFIAAGTAYSTHGINTIPFFAFYSMFGMQRIGDLVWAASDMRCRGFLLGATAGRTTLAGEGLQHQDGQSHVLALPSPNLLAYDPAWAYELAVIVQDGIRRMYQEQESVFYYITITNENYAMPPMPDGVREGILKGLYKFKASNNTPASEGQRPRVHLLGSGAILNEVLKAQTLLEERYNVAADAWSVTSYKELRRDALDVERWNLLHPEESARVPYVTACFENAPGVCVAASDYMRILPDGIAKWMPQPFVTLGTDGFGRSESRSALREFFEIDERFIAVAALAGLARQGTIEKDVVAKAIKDFEIDPERSNPMTS